MRRATWILARSPSGWLRVVSRPLWPESAAASTPRRRAARVARRAHHPLHALFTRPCKRCLRPVEYCGSCQPGRLYCGEGCSVAARAESVRRAQDKYRARDSREGREAHRLEEADRRARRALARVGDQRCEDEEAGLQPPHSTAEPATTETRNALPAFESLRTADPPPGDTEPADWVLVVYPGIPEDARPRLGAEASCPFCGRRGRIVLVVSIHEWRRRLRHVIGRT